ncbi:sca1 complex scaffold protein scaa [Anaeramoeba flamelloides]|uniref:Sca1 complex scaffold protein scaa n=1 Tax=Anaeramoeba flamelloides TaxID=1746091 RepID=A0ABQ8XFI4_9EUKA|nr:sca1 complex scaffold protein scaa [Anaeramoeba flamelloides]
MAKNSFYADEKGNLFDQNFESVNKEQLQFSNPILYHKITNTPNFPRTEQFEKYSEFEKEALKWTQEIKELFQQIKLPNVMGSYFYRPFLTEQTIEESIKKQQSLKNKKEPKTEKNETDDRDEQINKQEKNRISILREKRKLSPNLPNKEQKLINETENFLQDTESILGKNSAWQNTLIPKEPDPYDYNEYSEYQTAYQNWTKIVQETLVFSVPHANEFGKLYGVMTNEKKKQYAEDRKLLKENIRASSGNKDLNSKASIIGLHNNNYKTSYCEWIKKLNLKLFTYTTKEKELGMFYFSQDYYNSKYDEIKPKIKFFLEAKKNENENENKNKNQIQKRKREIKKYTIEAIQKYFLKINRIYQKINTNKSIKDIGIIHGTFPHESGNSSKIYYDTNSLSCFSLKRGDLDGMMLLKGLDCLPIIDKKQVQFVVPNYDEDKPLEIRKLREPSNEHYINNKRNSLRSMDNENKFQCFYTWYYPTIYSEEKCELDKSQIIRQINSHKNKTMLDRISSVFITKAKFDTFKELLDEEVVGNNLTFTDTLNALLDKKVDVLNSLYLLFFNYNSNLIHIKLSYFLNSLFKSGKLNYYIEHYIKNSDVKNLSLLVYGCNYFNISFNYLFLIKEEIQHYSKLIFNSDCWDVEKLILQHHYLIILLQIFENLEYKDKSNQKNFLNKFINTIQSNLKSKKKQFANFFNTHIYMGIGNRSTKVSGYYSFLFVCLLQFFNKDIIDLLFDSNVHFLNKIIDLSKSKFSHVKYSIKTIWKLMIKNDIIRQFLITNLINNNKNYFFKQLMPQFSKEIESVLFNSKNNNNNNNNNNNSINRNNNLNNNEEIKNKKDNNKLFPICLLDLINESMLKIKLEIIPNEENIDNKKKKKKKKKKDLMESLNSCNPGDLFFLSNNFFTLLIDFYYWALIKKNINSQLFDKLAETINNISKIFKKIRNYIIFQRTKNKNKKKETKLMKEIKLQCNSICLDLKRINYLFEIIKKLNDNERVIAKIQLLEVINHLIISEQLFKKINKNPKFFSDLNTIIRSNSDLNVIDKACEIFHSFILSHPYGINYLIDTKQFRTFVSQVGSNSDISTFANGLHIFFKLFNLHERQFSKQKRNKKLKRAVGFGKKNILATIKEDQETFIDFFSENSLFVKLNMLFQKYLNHKNSDHISGLILSSLAKVYSIILSKDYCVEILYTNQKKQQYQDGLEFFQKMIYGNIPEKFWHEIASVGKGKHYILSKKSGLMSKKHLKSMIRRKLTKKK